MKIYIVVKDDCESIGAVICAFLTEESALKEVKALNKNSRTRNCYGVESTELYE